MPFALLGPDDPALSALDQRLRAHPEWETALTIVPWAEYRTPLMAVLTAPTAPYRRELYSDPELHLETAKLKFEFMTNAQSLIHGDLHTGSIFVTPESTKVIDPEFAFYGPIWYDTGNVVANLIFAWANADATIGDPAWRADYTAWLEETLAQVVDQFQAKFLQAWDQHATEVYARVPGFKEWYLAGVLRDTAGVTGLELCRRIVGLAHVKDITSIEDWAARLRAERICLTAAKGYIKRRESFRTGSDFVAALKRSVSQYPR